MIFSTGTVTFSPGPRNRRASCARLLRGFEAGTNRRSERWYRVFNEVTVLLFIAAVVLVVVKPF